jgi:hypothetical protein
MGFFISKPNPRVTKIQPGQIIEAIHKDDKNFPFISEDLSYHLSSVISIQYSWTYLHLAVWMNRLEIVEKLVNLGAEVNIQDDNGDTPLHLALIIHNRLISQFLLEKGAKSDLANSVKVIQEGFRALDLMKDDLAVLLDYGKFGRTETEVEEGNICFPKSTKY